MRKECREALEALAKRVARGSTQTLQGGRGDGYSSTVGEYSPWEGGAYWVSAEATAAADLMVEVWSAPNGSRYESASVGARQVYAEALEAQQ